MLPLRETSAGRLVGAEETLDCTAVLSARATCSAYRLWNGLLLARTHPAVPVACGAVVDMGQGQSPGDFTLWTYTYVPISLA